MESAGIKAEESTTLAAVTYLFSFFQMLGLIGMIVVYLTSKDKFTRFHAFQALLMEVAFLAIFIVEFVIAVLLLITVVGYFIMIIVMILTALCSLAATIYLAIQASQGETPMLPGIGGMARDQVE